MFATRSVLVQSGLGARSSGFTAAAAAPRAVMVVVVPMQQQQQQLNADDSAANNNNNNSATTQDERPLGVQSFSFVEAKEEYEKKADRPGLYLPKYGGCVNVHVRRALVNKAVVATSRLQLDMQTLHQAVSLLDRTLCKLPLFLLSYGRLRLLMCVCLWLATKLEESYPHMPSARAFLQAMDLPSEPSALHEHEIEVLKVLDFSVTPQPTAQGFLSLLVQGWGLTPDTLLWNCAWYLVEAALQEAELLRYPDSKVAAAAFAGAFLLTGEDFSFARLKDVTGYTILDVWPAVVLLLNVHADLCEDVNAAVPTVMRFNHAETHNVVRDVRCIKANDDDRLVKFRMS